MICLSFTVSLAKSLENNVAPASFTPLFRKNLMSA